MPKRRARGEGTLYQRKDGLWSAQISFPDGRRKTKYGRTQLIVRDWLIEQQALIRQKAWASKETAQLTAPEVLLPEILKAPEVAKILRISVSGAYSMMRRGELPCFHIGTSPRVRRADLNRWIAEAVEANQHKDFSG
jgi:excisionase family DNA binding protein